MRHHAAIGEKKKLRLPTVDLGECTLCEGCLEVSPTVFKINDTGYIEVAELDTYPVGEVDEAIKICPVDCIYWEEK